MDFLNIDKDMIVDKTTGNVMEKTMLQNEFSKRIDKFFKTIEAHSDIPNVKENSKRLKKKIKALATGSKGYEVHVVANELKNMIEKTMGKKAQFVDTKLAVQKIASMYAVVKRYENFKEMSEEISGHDQILDSYMEMANRHENPHSLFGENVEMQFIEDGKTGKVISMKDFKRMNIKDSDVIATGLKGDDGNKYAVIKEDSASRIIRHQPSELLTIELSNFEKGVYKKDGMTINAQTKLGNMNGIDNSISRQMTRNMYVNFNGSITKDLAYKQWQLLRDQGILLTKTEMENVKKLDDRSQFVQLTENNPLSKAMGSKYYIDKRFKHYIEGDKGIDVRKLGRELGGDGQFGRFIEKSVLGLSKTTDVMANFILVSHPASYINSFLSSMTIYASHITGIASINDVKAAKASYKGYKENIAKFAEIYGQDPKKGVEYWNNVVKQSPLHKLVDAGVVNTIRADMYKIANPKQFALYNAIKDATGNTGLANGLKSIAMDPGTPHGNKLAEAFDYTELMPKIMLFENLKRNGMKAELAAQKVMMAFPTYNNLPKGMNMLSAGVPDLKFFASLPKMIMYGIDQSPRRMIGGVIAAQSVTPLSYAFASEEEQKAWKWNIDNGFIKIPGFDYSYASMSLFPIWSNPLSSPFGTTPFSVDFVYSAGSGILSPSKYIPGTSLPEVD